MKLMLVHEAARELEVSESWLRRAEGHDRIPKAHRDINGWRVYTQEDIAALRAVLLPRVPDAGDQEGAGP
jgi:DNA-binding transcriptional MerR regulator